MNRAYSTPMPSTHAPNCSFSVLGNIPQADAPTVDLIMVDREKTANTFANSILLKDLLRSSLADPPTLLIPKTFGVVSQVCHTQPQLPVGNKSLALTPELAEPPSDGPVYPQPQPAEPTKLEPSLVLQLPAPLPPIQATKTNKNGLQFTKHDIKYGFTKAEDALLFGGARQRQNSKADDDPVMVFNYLKWQAANFSASKPTSQKFLKTDNLRQTEAGEYHAQETPILTLNNLKVQDKPSPIKQQLANRHSQDNNFMALEKPERAVRKVAPQPEKSTRSYPLSVAGLAAEVSNLTAITARLNQKITKLQQKKEKQAQQDIKHRERTTFTA